MVKSYQDDKGTLTVTEKKYPTPKSPAIKQHEADMEAVNKAIAASKKPAQKKPAGLFGSGVGGTRS